MRVNSISNTNNTNFTAKVNYKKASNKIVSHKSCSNNANSVLLYFAGLLDTFGLKRPLTKLIEKLHNL